MKRPVKKEQARQLIKDAAVSFGILAICTLVCTLLADITNGEYYASMLYILSVFLISLFTEGYFFGIVSSVLCVLLINFFFTYPYFNFNFMLPGYPLTIVCTFAVSVTTSAITTRLKRNNDLKIMAEKEKTRGNLLRALSHDIRTPLTTILGAADTVIDGGNEMDEATKLSLMVDIKTEAEYLIRMVENLLSVTRIDDGKEAVLKKCPELCEEIVAEAIRKFSKRFPEISVRAEIPKEVLVVSCDAMLIIQVLINLLENVALHAKGACGAFVTTERCDEGIRFCVFDDGCGIDEEVLPDIFNIYHERKKQSGFDTGRNMGIGLPVCRTIVNAHGGRMFANNRQLGGAQVGFVLPAIQEDSYGA